MVGLFSELFFSIFGSNILHDYTLLSASFLIYNLLIFPLFWFPVYNVLTNDNAVVSVTVDDILYMKTF